MLAALALLLLSAPAWGASGTTTISYMVPGDHTVTVDCGPNGKVTVGGADFTGDNNEFPMFHGHSITVTAVPNSNGHTVGFAVNPSGNASGMTLGVNSVHIGSVVGDVTIGVTFTAPPPPPSGPGSNPGSRPQTPTPPPAPETDPEPEEPPPAAETQPGDEDEQPVTEPDEPAVPGDEPPVTEIPAAPPNDNEGPAPDAAPTDTTPALVTVPVTGAEQSIEAEALVTGSVAEVSVDVPRLDELMTADTGAETVTIDLSAVPADIDTVVIPVVAMQAVAEQAASDANLLIGMEVALPRATVTFDVPALDAIVEQAREDTVTLHVKEVGPERLTPPQQEVVAATPEVALIVEVTLRSGDEIISDFRDGSAEVRLPYTPAPGEDTATITVWYIAADGSMEQLPCTYADGLVIFTVHHLSNYIIMPGNIITIDPAATGPTDPNAGPDATGPNAPDDAHCFICALLGTTAAPWCWLIPLLVILAIAGAAYLRHRRK